MEQLRAAALGVHGPAEPEGHDRGRWRHVQDFDAKLDSAQQLTDVETLINGGADVLILLAQDQDAAVSALELAANSGIPVIAYDRLIEDPSVLYITFDNVGVGKAEAQAIFDKVPTGTYVRIKGDPGDANASTFLPQGMDKAGLQDKIDAGDIILYRRSSSRTAGRPRPPRTTWRPSSTRRPPRT